MIVSWKQCIDLKQLQCFRKHFETIHLVCTLLKTMLAFLNQEAFEEKKFMTEKHPYVITKAQITVPVLGRSGRDYEDR